MDGVQETRSDTTLPAWATRRLFSVDDYHKMDESGLFEGRRKVELLEGEIIEMAAIGGPHIGTVMALTHLLVTAVGDRARVSVQSSVRLDDRSQPEPDIALLRPRADHYRGKAPPLAADVLLLVEVADSSLRLDREVKLPLYARHGILEVWIVDLVGGAVDVFRGPGEGGFARMERVGGEGVLEPEALPGVRIAAAEVLSG